MKDRKKSNLKYVLETPVAEQMSIANHGAKKRILTDAKNKLRQSTLKDHPDVKKVILLLEAEHKRLCQINPLEL